MILSAILLFTSCEDPESQEQIPQLALINTYGGIENDRCSDAFQTFDGGYIVVGYTDSYGAGRSDVWLIKTDASGDTLWTRTFGGPKSDRGVAVQQTSDGGYIITGNTESYGAGEWDVWLIKTDASGDTLWTRTFGGASGDTGNAVLQTFDGGYIIAGGTYSYAVGDWDVWLIKTDAAGDSVWARIFGGSHSDSGNDIQQTLDGGYIITGHTYSDSWDFWLIKTDAEGDSLWTVTYDGGGNDHGYSVRQTSDGGYIIAGDTYIDGASFEVLLIKCEATGEITWIKTYGGSVNDSGKCVRQTSDGGYIITGSSSHPWLLKGNSLQDDVGDGPLILFKTDETGELIWTTTFEASGRSVIQASDGEYIVFGTTHSYGAGGDDICIIKEDDAGL